MNLNSWPNLIKNFPSHYGPVKSFYANMIHFFGDLKVLPVMNQLTKEDIKKFKKTLKPGDVVLAGGLGLLSSLFVQGAVTHALIYLGKKKFVHVTAHGVGKAKTKVLYKNSDTLMILRHPDMNKIKLKQLSHFLKGQMGLPYNFDFEKTDDSYICSDLVKDAFDACDLTLELPPMDTYLFHELVHPKDYASCKVLEVQYMSSNLKMKDGRVVLV